jgi:hypothetical protein
VPAGDVLPAEGRRGRAPAGRQPQAAIDAFGYLLDLGLLPQDVFGESVKELGAKPRKMPTVMELAQVADQKVRGSGALRLYQRFYGPTSTFFVHANASSLLRHVKADNTLTDKPTFPWTYRSGGRVADASVGLLAAAVAEHAGAPDAAFTEYAEAHIARAFTPLAAMMGKGMRRTLKWSLLPALIKEIRTLRGTSGQAAPQRTRPRCVRRASAPGSRPNRA